MLYIAEFLVEKLGLAGAWGVVMIASAAVMWHFGRGRKKSDFGA